MSHCVKKQFHYKAFFRSIVVFITLTLLLTHCMLFSVFAATLSTSAAFNVVFVVDTSESLFETDRDDFRIQGVGRMLAFLPFTGSTAGLVTFSTKAQTPHGMKLLPMNTKSDVEQIYSAVKSQELKGFTNITEAMEKAMQFFTAENGMNPSIPNLIVLFSDGEIDFENGNSVAEQRAIDKSYTRLIEIGDEANSQGIRIVTIALNKGGIYNTEKLSKLSGKTGDDLFFPLESADDLVKTFDDIHTNLFKAQSHEIGWFQVPRYGKIALTLILTLDNPDDTFVLKHIMSDDTYTAEDAYRLDRQLIFTLPNPPSGSWHCQISGGKDPIIKVMEEDDEKLTLFQQGYNKISTDPLLCTFAGSIFSTVLAVPSGIWVNWLSKDSNKKRGTWVSVIICAAAFSSFMLFVFFGVGQT